MADRSMGAAEQAALHAAIEASRVAQEAGDCAKFEAEQEKVLAIARAQNNRDVANG